MFPWRSGPTEAQLAALQAARQAEVDEHEAAVQRLAEAQETGGVTPPPEKPGVMRGYRLRLLRNDGPEA